MGEPIRVYLSRHDEAALRADAQRNGRAISDHAREILVNGGPKAPPIFAQFRLWWIKETRAELEPRLAATEKQLATATEHAQAPRTPKLVRHFYDAQATQLRDEAARIRARLAQLDDEEHRILHPTTVAPMLILLQTDLAGNLTNATTPPAATNAAQAISFAPLWPYALGALVVVAIGIAYWQHKRGNLDLRRFTNREADESIPAHLEHPSEDAVYESMDEMERKYAHNPTFLSLRVERFLDQEMSEEKLRQFCEDYEWNAVHEDGEAVPIRLLPVTQEQYDQIPTAIQIDLLSARTRGRLTRAHEMLRVEVQQGTNGNGHHSAERRGPGRPPGSKNKPKPVLVEPTVDDEPEGAEN